MTPDLNGNHNTHESTDISRMLQENTQSTTEPHFEKRQVLYIRSNLRFVNVSASIRFVESLVLFKITSGEEQTVDTGDHHVKCTMNYVTHILM